MRTALGPRSFLPTRRTEDPNYSQILNSIGKDIFTPEHQLEPYYTSAFAHYKLEFFFRNGQLDVKYKPSRYHMLMALRYVITGKQAQMPALAANKVVKYCDTILNVLWDDQKAANAFSAASDIIQKASGGNLDRDAVRTQAFTNQVLATLKQ